MSRFCFSRFPCLFPQTSIQNLTASSAVQNTHRPKVCAHTLMQMHTHTHIQTPCLSSSISLTLQWFPVPCRPWMRCTLSLQLLPSPAPEDFLTAWQESSDRSQRFSSSRSRISIQMNKLNAGNIEWDVTVPSLQKWSSRCESGEEDVKCFV